MKGRPPATVRWINSFGRNLERIGVKPVGITPEILKAEAVKRTGFHDFGEDFSHKGLDVLTDSIERDANLSLIGRLVARESLTMLMANKLSVQNWLAETQASPETLSISSPVFIVGLPRSGTTFLHGLLSADPRFRSPLSWEMHKMDRPPEADTPSDDPRILATEKAFSQFEKLAPGTRAAHALYADAPQECLTITAQMLMGEQISSQMPVQSYQKWLLDQNHLPAYRWHRAVLGFLQGNGTKPDHWLLKSPVHADRLAEIFTVYPDARIIATHRDPVEVVPSLVSLISIFHRIVTDSYDQVFWSRFILEWISTTFRRGMEQRKRLDGNRFTDLNMDSLVRDPIGAVKNIYAGFGWSLSGEVEKDMREFVAIHTRNRHGVHRYSLEEYGLSADEIRDLFDFYYDSADFRIEDAS